MAEVLHIFFWVNGSTQKKSAVTGMKVLAQVEDDICLILWPRVQLVRAGPTDSRHIQLLIVGPHLLEENLP